MRLPADETNRHDYHPDLQPGATCPSADRQRAWANLALTLTSLWSTTGQPTKRWTRGRKESANRRPAEPQTEPYGTIQRSWAGCSSEHPVGWTLSPHGGTATNSCLSEATNENVSSRRSPSSLKERR